MRVLFLILLLIPSFAFGQYWGERVTEQSFERSALYFKNSFLNTYGLYRFGDAAVGLVDDPFLRLYLNPAELPDLGRKDYQLYLDFRGDRTEEEVINRYYALPMDYIGFYPDPRWYSQTREEPEPIFSLGVLAYPGGRRNRNLFLGATYQIIYKQEKYYSVPSWIYYYRFGYDAFGEKSFDDPAVPVEERYLGKDELTTEANILTGYLGYVVSRRVKLGVSVNGTWHNREGGYINSRRDEYSTTEQRDYRYLGSRERNQDYSHFDISAGIRYKIDRETWAGLKLGYLSGEADQVYEALDTTTYQYNIPEVSDSWSHSFRGSRRRQTWNHDGDTKYGTVNFAHNFENDNELYFYYNYGAGNIDLSSFSIIRDSSNYSSQYTYDTLTYRYFSESQTIDDRTSTGERKKKTHQAMLSMKWFLERKTTLYGGVYFSHEKTDISTAEPVVADRWSDYQREVNDSVAYSSYHRVFEDKQLAWEYNSTYWTIQIPILLHFQINRRFSFMLGVNRILESWKTREQTTAYFTIRETTQNGGTETETNFAEKYTQPAEKVTEDYTAVISSLEVTVSPEFSFRLLISPDLEDELSISQWWLSFELRP